MMMFYSPLLPTHRRKPLVLLMALSLSAALHAAPAAKKSEPSNEPITLNFVNADIESVARTLATLSQRNLVIDPRVKGTINLTTEQPVPPAQAWAQFMATLRMQGYAVVETKGVYKIVPEADAKLQGGSVQQIEPASPSASGGQIVTQIFKLNFESANNLVAVLRPLISPNNTINVNPGTNSLVITDYADNLQRIGRIVAALDVANASDVEVIPLEHAVASDLVPLLSRLIDSGATSLTSASPNGTPNTTDTGYRTTLLADPRSNAIILRAANPARMALVRSLVAKLDKPGTQNPGGNIYVVYLKNADATKLANTLRAAVLGGSSSTLGSTGNTASFGTSSLGNSALNTSAMSSNPLSTSSGTSNSLSASGSGTGGGMIQADAATNSLIINAPEPQYRQLRAVIDQLDQRRAQVLVESLIAEVNADKAVEMGIQWQNATGSPGGTIGIIGTNFTSNLTSSIGNGNILGVSANGNAVASALGNGLNIGSVRQVNGTYVLNSLAHFLEQTGDGNILSTPTLLTLDNEEAKIVVGQNVPFVTGQYTNNNSNNGAVNPFQTIERKDVGLTLKVKPQISETGTVRLTIFQEVSSVVPTSVNSASGIITNKRSIESNVQVDDGSIVVLGGLLSDTYAGNKSQVPGLGNIPVLGWLFRDESRSRSKANLMVFLRPVVVRDAASVDALSNNRYQQMLGLQLGAQPSASNLFNTDGAAVMPPAPVPAPKAAPAQPSQSGTPSASPSAPAADH